MNLGLDVLRQRPECGSSREQIFEDPREPYTKALLKAAFEIATAEPGVVST